MQVRSPTTWRPEVPIQVWQGHCPGTPPHPLLRAWCRPAWGLWHGACSLCPVPSGCFPLCLLLLLQGHLSLDSGPTLNAGCWQLEALNYFRLPRPYSK